MSKGSEIPRDLLQELLADALAAASDIPSVVTNNLLGMTSRNYKTRLVSVRNTISKLLSTLDHVEDTLLHRGSSSHKSTPRKSINKEAIHAVEYLEFCKEMDNVQSFLGAGAGMKIPVEHVLRILGHKGPLFPEH